MEHYIDSKWALNGFLITHWKMNDNMAGFVDIIEGNLPKPKFGYRTLEEMKEARGE